MTVGDFLTAFARFAKETPKALVYTDTSSSEGSESEYMYIKSVKVERNCVLLGIVNGEYNSSFLDAETILSLLKKAKPSLSLLADCYGDRLELSLNSAGEVLEYDHSDPKEIFFYVESLCDEDFYEEEG